MFFNIRKMLVLIGTFLIALLSFPSLVSAQEPEPESPPVTVITEPEVEPPSASSEATTDDSGAITITFDANRLLNLHDGTVASTESYVVTEAMAGTYDAVLNTSDGYDDRENTFAQPYEIVTLYVNENGIKTSEDLEDNVPSSSASSDPFQVVLIAGDIITVRHASPLDSITTDSVIISGLNLKKIETVIPTTTVPDIPVTVPETTVETTTPENPTTTVCHEDEPCWDCETMGNMICGSTTVELDIATPTTQLPSISTTVPAEAPKRTKELPRTGSGLNLFLLGMVALAGGFYLVHLSGTSVVRRTVR